MSFIDSESESPQVVKLCHNVNGLGTVLVTSEMQRHSNMNSFL